MTATITRMRVRVATPKFEVIWFDGKNGIEVAQFLQDNDKRCEVEFHGYGTNLKIDHKQVNFLNEDRGIWVGSDGKTYPKREVDETLEVLNVL